ncbi:MAG: hypothetical protein ACI9FB_002805 [Candidatus Azotimanducaceae bacterium]|jgi:hypothetical protein
MNCRDDFQKSAQLLILGLSLLTLSACSGGGGGSSTPVPTSAPPPPAVVIPPTTTPPVVQPDPVTILAAVPIPEFSTDPFLLSDGSRGLIVPDSESAIGPNVIACTSNIRERQGCSFTELPLIGMVTSNPTIDDVMERVVVSHEWMRVRFREILEQMPPEVLLMTRGLTAIVISYDIRPSFYYPFSGAIYLDPNGMWLTEEEEAVIDETPDFRSEFGSQLQFIILWRYVQDNSDIRSLDRDLSQISMRTAALLFHELAHANDFFSPGRVSFIDRTVAPIDAIANVESDALIGTFPLLSSTMRSLAQVSFRGATATTFQSALTSEDIAVEFPSDTANDYYNFNTQYEDLAMSFEEAMMYHSYGISRDVAVTNFPDTNFCDQYLVAWGQRNRIADPSVQARSMLTVRALLPEIADQVQVSLDSLVAPVQMELGLNWCDNINLSAPLQRGLSGPQPNAVRTVESLLPYQ